MENILPIVICAGIIVLVIYSFWTLYEVIDKKKYIREIERIKQDKLWDLFIEHYKEFVPKYDFTEAPVEGIIKIYCMEDKFGNSKYSCAIDDNGLCYIYVSWNPNMKNEYQNDTVILSRFNEEKSRKMVELLESYNY